MKTYHGRRGTNGCTVSVDEKPLDPRTDIRQISTTGFEWGYMGSGPRQLALAILADHFDDTVQAVGQYKPFCDRIIASLSGEEWLLDSKQIDEFLSSFTDVAMTLPELLNKVRGLK